MSGEPRKPKRDWRRKLLALIRYCKGLPVGHQSLVLPWVETLLPGLVFLVLIAFIWASALSVHRFGALFWVDLATFIALFILGLAFGIWFIVCFIGDATGCGHTEFTGPPRPVCRTVEDVREGTVDRRGLLIKEVYAKEPLYSVYGTSKGPQVQFAEDAKVSAMQREAYSAIAPLVVEIATLQRQWRGFTIGAAELRTAGAIRAALSGYPTAAMTTLKEVKAQVIAQRELRGRAWTLLFSFSTALVVTLVFVITVRWHAHLAFWALWTRDFPSLNPWTVVVFAGMVGALFSSTIAVREKSLAADLNRLENFVDGASRVFVGAVAAVALFIFFKAGLVPSVKVGEYE